MTSRITFLVASGLTLVSALFGQDNAARARQLEASGDSAGALRVLREAASASSAQPAVLMAYADFLDRHNSPQARATYAKLLPGLTGSEEKRAVLHRLAVLSIQAGDREAASRYLSEYRAAGGTVLPASIPNPPAPPASATTDIPGPLHSFARMAALSPDLKPDELLPALARNIITNGYQASNSQEALEQTEFLKLVFRYLSQARELEKLSGESKTIRIDQCESQATGDLLRVLGYRMRGACGSDVVLETVNASRAFLTIDSGFPLAELEQALRTNRAFTYDFRPTKIQVLYGPDYWMSSKEKQSSEFVDVFMSDPALCRLYLGLAKLDGETAEELRKAVPVQRLKAFAHVLDFFGGMFLVRNGKVVVPGGSRSEAAWGELAGVQPSQGAAFVERLISKDDGWLNSYFDSLSRIEGPVLNYLTEPDRLKRFYTALRGRVTSPGPARPVFRSNTDLMLLTTRLRIDSNGQPHIPGGVEIWKNLFIKHPHGKYDGKLTKAAAGWKEADDVIEALFALCRKAVENEPLKIFMALSDLNRHRTTVLQPATVDRLARSFRTFASQYPVFAELPTLSDQTIAQYLDVAEGISELRDQSLRADTAGIMQSLVSLWQIFTRNQIIPASESEAALAGILTAFNDKVKDRTASFNAGVTGVRQVLKSAGVAANANVHERMLDLLAGTAKPTDQEAHEQMIQDMIRVFEAQKLISLKTLVDIADHLDALAKGEKLNPALFTRLTTRMQEIQLPRAALTGVEKNALSFGYWTERHIDQQRKLNLRQAVERAGADPNKLADIRGQLTPILRDTLVGFNYLYYAPPGAQILKTNPLFVRSHDFLGVQGTNQTWRHTEVLGTGWPSSAGGRLVGSLAGVAYALAEAEQNFLIPSREQALIWNDLVPQMMISAKVPRWWHVTPSQMHFTALHLRLGESLLAESTLDPKLRAAVVEDLGRKAAPARTYRVDTFLASSSLEQALDHVTASELFFLAAAYLERNKNAVNPLAAEIRRLSSAAPDSVNYAAVSRAFGTPKPTLTTSYRTELLNLRTFPTLMGYSSRIMAESWESNVLYYAALADELHLPPSKLNTVVPEWTARTVERIFATHLEDWPALLRSLRHIGGEVRASHSSSGNTAERATGGL
jgi:hypothetical protein